MLGGRGARDIVQSFFMFLADGFPYDNDYNLATELQR